MKWGRRSLAVGLALTLGMPAVALADDSAIGSIGGTVRPIGSADIRMEAETVQAVVYGRFAEFRVVFRFVNDGPERTVKLGFPFARPDEGDFAQEAAFRAWQDDKQLPVTTVDGTDSDQKVVYYVHTATFRPGVTMITVSYLADPSSGVIGSVTPMQGQPARFAGTGSLGDDYTYWLHTGAGWKGSIGRAVVRFSFADDFVGWGVENIAGKPDWMRTQPSGWKNPDPHTLQWDLRDLDPTRASDVRVGFYAPFAYELSSTTAAKLPVRDVTASSHLKLSDQYDYVPFQVADGAPNSAWAEGAAGSGIGEWVKVTFGAERPVHEIRVVPGYAKREDLFRKYNRPSSLRVTFSDGMSRTLHLADEASVQRFPVDADGRWAKVVITGVYRGTTRDETYLSEIEFGGASSPPFSTFAALTGIRDPKPAQVSAPTSSTVATPVPAVDETSSVTATATAAPAGDTARLVYTILAAVALLAAMGVGAMLAVKRTGA